MSEAASGQPPQDKFLTCVDCGAQFVFSARDQMFYQERGYQPPRRCKGCRDKRKSNQHPVLGPHAATAPVTEGATAQVTTDAGAAGPAPGKGRELHKVSCSACGIETTVPFKPDPNRPVYCRSCYVSRRKAARSAGAGGGGAAPHDASQQQ